MFMRIVCNLLLVLLGQGKGGGVRTKVLGEIINRSSECHPADRICEINDLRDECMRPLGEDTPANFLDKPYYPFTVEEEIRLGVTQLYDPLNGWRSLDEFRERYMAAIYYKDKVDSNPQAYNSLEYECVLKNERCLEYAWLDDLCFPHFANAHRWMSLNCCAACEDIGYMYWYTRCQSPPKNETMNPYVNPGDMNKSWIRTLTMFHEEGWSFRVHGAPINITELIQTISGGLTSPTTLAINYDYKIGGPWIVTVDDYVTEEERERLRYHAEAAGYERSLDNGARVMEHRTSEEAGCTSKTQCDKDPVVQNLIERISVHLGIPSTHMDERLQLLRYSTGQQYQVHQDYHQTEAYGLTGARIATFYMYLSDVDAGGETWFPYVDVKVTPKAGRAIAWSNVLDDDPFEEDRYARHAGLPVERGVKYGATAWFRHHYNRNVPDNCFVG